MKTNPQNLQKKKKQISFYVYPEMQKALKQKALEEDIPVNSLILQAVENLLGKKEAKISQEDKKKRTLEILQSMQFNSGEKNLSQKVDKIVYGK
jgi:hypothetical protein